MREYIASFIWALFAIFALSIESYHLIFYTLPILAGFLVYLAFPRLRIWTSRVPFRGKFIYITPLMGVRPSVLGHILPEGYRLSCLFLGYGIIDRTETLEHGFPYDVLDPIPQLTDTSPSMQELCDQRGAELANIAHNENKKIRVYWSGSINSTASCIAMIKAMHNQLSHLEIAYTPYARSAYPDFYQSVIKKIPSRKMIKNFTKGVHPDRLMVFGEHGDQLFGSRKAFDFASDELKNSWERQFPDVLREKFQSSIHADTVLKYLEPQFSNCPIPLTNFYDLLWWIEFSLHWQSSSMRLLASQDQKSFRNNYFQTVHFFSGDPFQIWSLKNPLRRLKRLDVTYKWSLKNYICEFMDDENYYNIRRRCIPIRDLIDANHKGYAQAIDNEHNFYFQPYNKDLSRLTPATNRLFHLKTGLNSPLLWQNINSYEGK